MHASTRVQGRAGGRAMWVHQCVCVHACVCAHVRVCVPKNRNLHQGQKIAKNTCIIGRACYVCTSVCVCVRACVCAHVRVSGPKNRDLHRGQKIAKNTCQSHVFNICSVVFMS